MSKNRRRALIIFLLFCLYITYFFAQNFVYYLDLQEDLEAMEGEIASLEEDRQKHIEELEYAGSLDYVEKVAREKLGLVKEGETLMVIIEE